MIKAFFFLLLIPGSLDAQVSDSTTVQRSISLRRFWIDVGTGGANKARDAIFVPHASIRLQNGYTLISAFWSKSSTFDDDDFTDHFAEVGLMIGRVKENRWGRATISAGLSYYESRERGAFNSGTMEYAEDKSSSIGLPLEGQLIFKPIPALGLGIRAYFNPLADNFGTAVTLNWEINRFTETFRRSSPGDQFWWVELSRGSGGIVTDDAPKSLGLTYMWNERLLGIRYAFHQQRAVPWDKFRESAREFTVLYGLAGKSKWFMTAFSSGVSVVDKTGRGKYVGVENTVPIYEQEKKLRLFVPVEWRATFTPFPFGGIGFKLQAHFSDKYPSLGACVVLQLGHLMK